MKKNAKKEIIEKNTRHAWYSDEAARNVGWAAYKNKNGDMVYCTFVAETKSDEQYYKWNDKKYVGEVTAHEMTYESDCMLICVRVKESETSEWFLTPHEYHEMCIEWFNRDLFHILAAHTCFHPITVTLREYKQKKTIKKNTEYIRHAWYSKEAVDHYGCGVSIYKDITGKLVRCTFIGKTESDGLYYGFRDKKYLGKVVEHMRVVENGIMIRSKISVRMQSSFIITPRYGKSEKITKDE